MKYLIFVLIVTLIGCNKQSKSTIVSQDSSVVIPRLNRVKTDTVTEKCVFNNDYKGLTIEWVRKLGKTNFIWIDRLKSAALPHGQDTIYLSQGGCVHYGISVVWVTHSNKHALDDSAYWANKSLKLAEEFGMEFYSQSLRNGKVRFRWNSNDSYWFEVEPDSTRGNLIYNGIGITSDNGTTVIDISQYFN